MQKSIRRELFAFYGLTFTLMFGCAGIYISFKDVVGDALFLVLYPAAYSPSLSALILTGFFEGKQGFRPFFASAFRWRVGWQWWLVSFLIFPIIWLMWGFVRQVTGMGGPIEWSVLYYGIPMLILAGYILTDTGALGEEFGWRGYALPRLLKLFSPMTASIIVGSGMAIWHLPGWFVGGLHFENLNFITFMLGDIVLALLLTWIYLKTKGSALLAGIIPHMMLNVTGDTEPPMYEITLDTVLFFGLWSVVIVILNRKLFFKPAQSVD